MSKTTVLIVEDERIVALDLAANLERLNYEIVGNVARVEEALTLVRQRRPGLVLMDILLKGPLDGIEAAEVIRREYDVPVVYVTAHSDPATFARAKLTGPFGYVLKPFEDRDLATQIELALDRHRTDRELRQQRERLRVTLASITEGYYALDERWRFAAVNPAAAQHFGRTAAELLGREIWDVTGSPPDSELRRRFEEARQRGQPQHFEAAATIDAGVWSELHVYPREALLEVYFTDISERRRAAETLSQSQAQLRALAERLQGVREEERSRIAREVHDVMGQLLTGLKMELAAIRRRAGQTVNVPSGRTIPSRLDSALGLVDELIDEVQRISSELRPSVLDNLGLSAAMEYESRRFRERSGIACELSLLSAEPVLTESQTTGLFRILQEILTNVARHAGAQHVRVCLRLVPEGLELEVSDDGRGIRPEDLRDVKSLGLLSIRERAAALDGEVEIHGEPGRGTVVRVRIPTAGPGHDAAGEREPWP